VSNREEFERNFPEAAGVSFNEGLQMYTPGVYGSPYNGKLNAIWRGWQAAKPKFTALCHSKTKQIGSPVGYLVQNEAGALAAVHNLGRVTWLDDCVAGPVEKAARAQDSGCLDAQKEFWRKTEAFADEFIDGYEFRGDEGDYTPDEKESLLIKDCVAGLLCVMEENGFIGSRAQDGGELIRYGIEWVGPKDPIAVPMEDGYWTPWHLANEKLSPPSAVVPKDDLLLQDVANKICEHLPEGFELRLCMENGAAWIELSDDHGNGRTLPEIDDVCVAVQLNNALCVACGWTEREQES
jgi:hypothetical protein